MNEITIPVLGHRKIGLGNYDRIEVGGQAHRLHHMAHEGPVLETDDENKLCQAFTYKEFWDLVCEGSVVVDVDYYAPAQTALRKFHGGKTFDQYPFHKRIKAEYEAALIDLFDQRAVQEDLGRSKETLDDVLPELSELAQGRVNERYGKRKETFTVPSATSFNRKWRAYHANGRDPLGLIDRKFGRPSYGENLDPDSLNLAIEHVELYASRTRPSVNSLYELLQAEVRKRNEEADELGMPRLTMPSMYRFRNMIACLDKFYVRAGRYGEEAAKKHFAVTNQGLVATRVGERIEIDDWKIDVMTLFTLLGLWKSMSRKERRKVQRVRVWVTAAIDAATGYILALKFSLVPNGEVARDVLRMILEDKTLIAVAVGGKMPWFGVRPFSIWTDQGTHFHSQEFLSAARAMRVVRASPPAGDPVRRPFAESLFRTMSHGFLDWYPGRTFGDYIEKGDYDAEENAAFIVEQLNRNLVRDVVDYYHNKPRERLGGETPHAAFVRLADKYAVRPPLTHDQMRHIFARRDTRMLTRVGIVANGIRYQDRFLQEQVLKSDSIEVEIGVFDPDISALSVQLPGHGWRTIPNVSGVARGTNLKDWLRAAVEYRKQHGPGADLTIDILLASVRDKHASGESAANIAELGAKPLSTKRWKQLEEQVFGAAGMALPASVAAIDLGEILMADDVAAIELTDLGDFVEPAPSEPRAVPSVGQPDSFGPSSSITVITRENGHD